MPPKSVYLNTCLKTLFFEKYALTKERPQVKKVEKEMVKTDGGEIEIESKSIENEETKDDDHENEAEDAEEEPEEEREPSPGLCRHFLAAQSL